MNAAIENEPIIMGWVLAPLSVEVFVVYNSSVSASSYGVSCVYAPCLHSWNTLKLNPITLPNVRACSAAQTYLGKNRNCSATAQVTFFSAAISR